MREKPKDKERLNHILEFIINPETGNDLIFSESEHTLNDSITGKQFKIIEAVPILLPEKEKEGIAKAPVHEKYNTEFTYIDHYQKDAEVFDYTDIGLNKANKVENLRLHQSIIKQVPRNTKNLLDVGCGDGWVASHYYKKNINIWSLDVSTINPVRAVKNYPSDNHFGIVADVFQLPFKENTFDCIIASEIIEHLTDPGTFIEGLVKILKPGGKLIITTPYNEKQEYTLCVHCNKPTPQSAHIHSFNEMNLAAILYNSGFSYEFKKFSNRFLVKLHINKLLQFSGYHFWKFYDLVANKIFPSPQRLMIIIRKR